MKPDLLAQFDAFFHALHNHDPYPWQRRLAGEVVAGDWPGAIDLPTGSGKTACLDIAVFALASQASRAIAERSAPRRIFFCVNRRVIVDEAYQRAQHIAKKIYEAEQDGTGILANVASALRAIAGTGDQEAAPPLDVLELRGGIYRDNRWARSLTQPTIVCTTLDQLGSRLLFRGYGVSPNAAPIHAALIAYDSLILLDEAHISEPFRQTLDHVTRYLDPDRWAEQDIGLRPVTVVPMTATPNEAMQQKGVIRLQAEDREVAPLRKRLTASKPAELRSVNGDDVAETACRYALDLAKGGPTAVGMVVNRVSTARKIYEALRSLQAEPNEKKRKLPTDAAVELVIGSMRPVDRDLQTGQLAVLVGPERPKPRSERTSFVVATQCLEVGADYDFDVLITECAALDALRQRFGRLNRAGREIESRAIILAADKSIKPEAKPDPIYGNALARTWNWLDEHATETTISGKTIKSIDFGIDAFTALLEEYGNTGRPPKGLLAPSASLDAPIMMPAYVDLWCQTAPKPMPDPDVSLFIHGPQGGEPDVQVCWRADLLEGDAMKPAHWCDVVALLPPTSAECMRVPISRVRRWLKDRAEMVDDTGDLIGEQSHDRQANSSDKTSQVSGVLWRGIRESELLTSPDDLRPGDTIVLPTNIDDADLLGHLPELYEHSGDKEIRHSVVVRDHGETAFLRARNQAALRLHPSLRDRLGLTFDNLLSAAENFYDAPPRQAQWRELLDTAIGALPDAHWLKPIVKYLSESSLRVEPYPDERGVVLVARRRLGAFLAAADEGEDETSFIEQETAVQLNDHTRHVVEAVVSTTKDLLPDIGVDSFKRAAELHDLGKADERFQAMLRRSNRMGAWLTVGQTSCFLAKSGGRPQTRAQRRAARERAGLPEGFRHEMLSVQLAQASGYLPQDPADSDLVLHLIAAHHGHARPFAPVAFDEELPSVEVNGISITHTDRAELIPPHRIDSGIPERFWRLTRRYGWWGLAYLEAVLRLADQQASANEERGVCQGGQFDQQERVPG